MAQQKGAALQDPFLNILRKERIPVSIYRVNGIKLQGQVESFDPLRLHYAKSCKRRRHSSSNG